MSEAQDPIDEAGRAPLGSWGRLYAAVILVTLAYLGALFLFSSWTF